MTPTPLSGSHSPPSSPAPRRRHFASAGCLVACHSLRLYLLFSFRETGSYTRFTRYTFLSSPLRPTYPLTFVCLCSFLLCFAFSFCLLPTKIHSMEVQGFLSEVHQVYLSPPFPSTFLRFYCPFYLSHPYSCFAFVHHSLIG